MALNKIRQRIAYYGAENLLAALPAHEFMDWIPHPAATPSTALVIGTHDGRDILAFIVSFGDKSPEVRYCSKPVGDPVDSSTIQPLTQDEVVRLPLKAPFKYNADISQPGKSNFSVVIQWYFMGLIEHGIECDYINYCPQFHEALKKINAGQDAEKEFEGSRKTPMMTEDSSEPANPRSAYGLRSAHCVNVSAKTNMAAESLTTQRLAISGEIPSAGVSEDEGADLNKLHKYLDSYNALYLLGNIPDPDEVQFVDQDFLHEAQPKKLFVGHHAETHDDIYAYMRPSGDFHGIKFYLEDTHGHVKGNISSKDVAKQSILHPFNKTFSKASQGIDQAGKARLTIMVKWYFIAAGIAKNCVLRETKAYPGRLRSALEFVAKHMGPAAVKPPHVASAKQTESGNTPAVTFRTVPCPSPAAHEEQPASMSNTADSQSPHGTKRNVEDAEFDDLTRLVAENIARTKSKDLDLTKRMNNIDQKRELLQLQLQKLDEEWKILDAQRKDVRTSFKRRSLAFGEEG
ncbi:hypothetical protein BKA66DRAFT_485959 [Pyrenochaeta sp. MPI-SDFR-AT-0127]|nr:hypothetical protein BKA66DRAFT_485959 [Pyrenochaeta sp. MPI-SDFR-AT-0127]